MKDRSDKLDSGPSNAYNGFYPYVGNACVDNSSAHYYTNDVVFYNIYTR
jgi:hypothetical protein